MQRGDGHASLREWRRLEPNADLYVTPAFGVDLPADDGDELELRATLPAFLRPINFLGWAGLAIGELQLTAPADQRCWLRGWPGSRVDVT